MPSDYAPSTSVLRQSRTRAVSVWLAQSQVTASCVMKVMIGNGRVTIHSATGGNVLFTMDWSGALVIVEGNELESPYRFHDLKSAVMFFDAVLLNRAANLSNARSTRFDLLEFGTS